MVYTVSLILFGAFLGMAGLQGWFLYCWRKLSEDCRNKIMLAIIQDRQEVEEKKIPDGWSEIIA